MRPTVDMEDFNGTENFNSHQIRFTKVIDITIRPQLSTHRVSDEFKFQLLIDMMFQIERYFTKRVFFSTPQLWQIFFFIIYPREVCLP